MSIHDRLADLDKRISALEASTTSTDETAQPCKKKMGQNRPYALTEAQREVLEFAALELKEELEEGEGFTLAQWSEKALEMAEGIAEAESNKRYAEELRNAFMSKNGTPLQVPWGHLNHALHWYAAELFGLKVFWRRD